MYTKKSTRPLRIKENALIAKIAAKRLRSPKMAITIGRTIYLFNVTKEKFLLQSKWVRHEMQHIKQFKKYGLLRFIAMYTWESIRNGYVNNKWEIEARNAENQEQ